MKNERIAWLDLARFLAIALALLCHATENVYFLEIEYMSSLNPLVALFGFISFTIGRIGVPIFLMITGYLLLGREYDAQQTRDFYIKRFMHLLICTWIWFAVYDLFLTVGNYETMSLRDVVMDMLFLKSVPMISVWYLPVIIGLYLLIPFVSNGIRNAPLQNFTLPLVFFGILCFGVPLVKTVNNALKLELPIYPMLSEGFSGGVYGLYIVLGYLIKKGLLKKIKTGIVSLLCVLSFAAAVAFWVWCYCHNYGWNMWYDCVFLAFASVFLFELISRIRKVPFEKACRFLSRYSFAVFIVHIIILILIGPFINMLSLLIPAKVVLLEISLLVLSYLLAYLISLIPKAGKYILYLK